MGFWDLAILDVFSFCILCLKLSSKSMRLFEFRALSEDFALSLSFMRGFLLGSDFVKWCEFRVDLDELNIGVAIVHVMIFGEFASVGFPAEVSGVDRLDGSIHLV